MNFLKMPCEKKIKQLQNKSKPILSDYLSLTNDLAACQFGRRTFQLLLCSLYLRPLQPLLLLAHNVTFALLVWGSSTTLRLLYLNTFYCLSRSSHATKVFMLGTKQALKYVFQISASSRYYFVCSSVCLLICFSILLLFLIHYIPHLVLHLLHLCFCKVGRSCMVFLHIWYKKLSLFRCHIDANRWQMALKM